MIFDRIRIRVISCQKPFTETLYFVIDSAITKINVEQKNICTIEERKDKTNS
jgi:hypothetical protein